jgi:23S rRNA pseudouridine2605 synthase
MRLNKFIAESGLASRRKSEDYILQGRVAVNGKTVSDLSFKIEPEEDIVEVDGEKIRLQKHVYYLLNKPKGFITTTKDEKRRRTVLNLIDSNERIFPVGRLDYDTTGLLLLTNDGDFANLLTHPKNNVPRVYEVKLDIPLEPKDAERLLKGILLDGRKSKFTRIEFPSSTNKKFVKVTTVEGRNHFVKNMFSALGYKVVSLNRSTFADFKADIPLGKYRKVSISEVKDVIKKYS